MESKDEIARAKSTAIAPVTTRVEGLDEALPEDIDVPRLRLIQATSKDSGEAKTGDFVLSSTGRNYGPQIKLIPIALFRSRGYFRKDEPQPACTSLDGKTPHGGESPIDPSGKIHHECATCFFAQRQLDPKDPKRRQPSPCAAQLNFLAFVLGPEDPIDEHQICQVRFKRTSWKCGQQIITNAQLNSMRVKTLWGTLYEITTKVEQGTIGKYAVPFQRVAGLTDPAIDGAARAYAAIWAGLREKLARASVAPDAEHEADAVDGDVVDGGGATIPEVAADPKAFRKLPKDDGLPFAWLLPLVPFIGLGLSMIA